jgi:hypothetical protein
MTPEPTLSNPARDRDRDRAPRLQLCPWRNEIVSSVLPGSNPFYFCFAYRFTDFQLLMFSGSASKLGFEIGVSRPQKSIGLTD